MTTIAYRDGILAADSLGDRGGLRTVCDKVYQVSGDCDGAIGVLIAGSGIVWRIQDIVKQCEKMALENTSPRLWPFIASNFYDAHHDRASDDTPSCLLIEQSTGNVVWLEGPRFKPVTFPHDYLSIGSGRDFALGAMAQGATAQKAIEIACSLDTYSGGPVVAYDCKAGKRIA